MKKNILLLFAFSIFAAVTSILAASPNLQAVIFFKGDLVDNLVRGLLPISVPESISSKLTTSPIAIVDAIYCGATDAGVGRYLARGMVASSPSSISPPVPKLTEADCSSSPREVSERLCAGVESQMIVDLRVSWIPWAVSLDANQVAYADQAKACESVQLQPLTKTIMRMPAGPLPLRRGLVVDDFFIALRFYEHSATLKVVSGTEIANFAKAASFTEIPPSPSDPIRPNNALFSMPIELLNLYGGEVIRAFPLTLPLPNAPAGFPSEIRLKDVLLSSKGMDGVALSGRTTTDNAGMYDLTMSFSGNDLTADGVSLSYVKEECSGRPLPQSAECLGRNLLRSQIATAVGPAATKQYAGTKVRPFGTNSLLRLELEGRSIDVIGFPTRVSRKGNVVELEAYLAIER